MLRDVSRLLLGCVSFELILFAALLCLAGCGGYNSSPPPPTSVSISPPSASVQAGIGTQVFTATVTNDYPNSGANWALSGPGCSGATCGSLSSITTSSVTYKAPAAVPSSPTVTLTATSVYDSAKTATATITVTAAVAVNISPAAPNVQVSQTRDFTATVQNDSQNKGVTWSLLGSGCSGKTCGNISANSSASGLPVTYTAPAGVPSPATVTLTATSVTDNAQVATAIITVTLTFQPISVTISPVRGGLTALQPQTFTTTLSNDFQGLGVSWSASGSACSGTACGTFTNQAATTAVYHPPATPGPYTITATSVADDAQSASATIGVTDLTGAFTYHSDSARTGQNVHEYALTLANVNTSTFGKLFSCAIDAAAYAQPLWVANLGIGGATHNVIFVATVHNSVYAFDADDASCKNHWQVSLMNSGETWGSSNDVLSSDIQPDIGIIGTPVIDPATNTLYVVSKSKDTSSVFHQRLHALDLGTGNEKFSGPVEISATVTGTGNGSSGGNLPFNALTQNQRPGLALVNGVVYITWASHGDNGPYHGWIIAYNAATLAQIAVFNTTPNGGQGGIWMSGSAAAADSSGNIYFATGNGTFNGTDEFGDSILKLGPPSSQTLPLLDFFTPTSQATLNAGDVDLGAGGVLVLPDLSSGTHPRMLVQAGKDGTIYLVNRDTGKMGGYCSGCPDKVIQELPNAINGFWSSPAYWNSNLYFSGAQGGGSGGDNMKLFSFNAGGSGLISTSPTSQSTVVFNFSSAVPSVSASGTTNGIVWGLDNSAYGPPSPFNNGNNGPAVLHAFDATNLANGLWNSSQAPGDAAGNAVKFTVPTVANGKVYVGGQGQLTVYGLLPN